MPQKDFAELLEEIRAEIRSASDELAAHQSEGAIHRLINAFFMLTELLETQDLF